MSEIKGQLLGILLVVAVFGIAAVALTSTFKKVSQRVEDGALAEADDLSSLMNDTSGLLHYN